MSEVVKIKHGVYVLCSESGESLQHNDTLFLVVDGVVTDIPLSAIVVELKISKDRFTGYSVLFDFELRDNILYGNDVAISFYSKKNKEIICVSAVKTNIFATPEKAIMMDDFLFVNKLIKSHVTDDNKSGNDLSIGVVVDEDADNDSDDNEELSNMDELKGMSL